MALRSATTLEIHQVTLGFARLTESVILVKTMVDIKLRKLLNLLCPIASLYIVYREMLIS